MHPIQKWFQRLVFVSITLIAVAYTLYFTLNNSRSIDLDLFFYQGENLPISAAIFSAFILGAALGLLVDFASRLKLRNSISVLEKKIAKLES